MEIDRWDSSMWRHLTEDDLWTIARYDVIAEIEGYNSERLNDTRAKWEQQHLAAWWHPDYSGILECQFENYHPDDLQF